MSAAPPPPVQLSVANRLARTCNHGDVVELERLVAEEGEAAAIVRAGGRHAGDGAEESKVLPLLHWAVCSGSKESAIAVIEYLLDNGFDINLQSTFNDSTTVTSPLASAAAYGSPHVLKFLIDKGAAFNRVNETDGSLSFENSPLALAFIHQRYFNALVLLENGYSLTETDASGDTFLHFAIKNKVINRLKIIPTLTLYGADVNASNLNTGKTPAHEAFASGNLSLCEVMLNLLSNSQLDSKFLPDNKGKYPHEYLPLRFQHHAHMFLRKQSIFSKLFKQLLYFITQLYITYLIVNVFEIVHTHFSTPSFWITHVTFFFYFYKFLFSKQEFFRYFLLYKNLHFLILLLFAGPNNSSVLRKCHDGAIVVTISLIAVFYAYSFFRYYVSLRRKDKQTIDDFKERLFSPFVAKLFESAQPVDLHALDSQTINLGCSFCFEDYAGNTKRVHCTRCQVCNQTCVHNKFLDLCLTYKTYFFIQILIMVTNLLAVYTVVNAFITAGGDRDLKEEYLEFGLFHVVKFFFLSNSPRMVILSLYSISEFLSGPHKIKRR